MMQMLIGALTAVILMTGYFAQAEEPSRSRQGVEKYLELRSKGILHRDALKTVMAEFNLSDQEIQAEAMKISAEGKPVAQDARTTASAGTPESPK